MIGEPAVRVIDRGVASSLLPRRTAGAHKWGVGGVVIVGGSAGYIGAPALASMSAGRTGAGIASLAVDPAIVPAISALVPEAVFVPRPGDAGSDGSVALRERLVQSRSLLVGPGLGRGTDADRLLGALFMGADPIVPERIATVIDADGLNWLAEQSNWSARLATRSLVLTPHPGEMSRLTGLPTADLLVDPAATSTRFAREWGQVVVFKTGPGFVSDGRSTWSGVDSPLSLASAGTGDVLAGMIAAFLAQGLGRVEAGALALWVGARAARLVEAEYGTLGLVASDLPAACARVLRDLEWSEGEHHG